MKKITFLLAIFLYTIPCWAQHPRQHEGSSRIEFEVNDKLIDINLAQTSFTLEGYDGTEFIAEADTPSTAAKISSNAAGLSLITSSVGKGDDSIFFRVMESPTNVFSIHIRKDHSKYLHIKIPRKAHLKMVFTVGDPNTKVIFKNLDGELEITGSGPVMEFDNITGPLILDASGTGFLAGGSEKLILSHLRVPQYNPAIDDTGIPFLNITTGYANVDISLPEDVKATLQTDLPYGNLYSDFNIIPQRPAFPVIKNRYTGNLNGGGKMIVIKATGGGNVYLRKQQ